MLYLPPGPGIRKAGIIHARLEAEHPTQLCLLGRGKVMVPGMTDRLTGIGMEVALGPAEREGVADFGFGLSLLLGAAPCPEADGRADEQTQQQ